MSEQDELTKRCTKCDERKPLTAFGARASARDGLRWWCRDCENARRRKYHMSNRETELERKRQWRAANPDYHREHARQWRANNPERSRAQGSTRRAREANAPAIESSPFIAAWEWWHADDPCWYLCGKPSAHTDHVIPLARGGTHERSNLARLCQDHNLGKGAKDPIEYVTSLFADPDLDVGAE